MDSDSGRHAPLAMDAATFRKLGHRLVDQLAGFLESLPFGPVTRDESPSVVRDALDLTGPLPEMGTDPGPLLEKTAQRLFAHSLFNGHPRFFGYITAPPAPIGILGDFLAAAVNPNVGAWTLSPAATEIESQTVRWIAELIGYPVDCGGLLLSGGNMANFVCLLAARTAKAGWDVREYGVSEDSGRRLRVYCSGETHTWIQKATDLGGLGTDIDPVDRHRLQITDGRLRATPSNRSGYRRGRCAIPGRGNGGIGQHRCRSILCRKSARSARSMACGSTLMEPMVALRLPFRRRTMIYAVWPWPIRLRLIRTNGSTRRSRPDARWYAIRKCCARRSRITLPTTISRRR